MLKWLVNSYACEVASFSERSASICYQHNVLTNHLTVEIAFLENTCVTVFKIWVTVCHILLPMVISVVNNNNENKNCRKLTSLLNILMILIKLLLSNCILEMIDVYSLFT